MINIKGNYNREFYIFEKVSNKYGIQGKELSGYLKIETKGEKGKLKVYVENISVSVDLKYYLKFYVINNEIKCIKSQVIWPVKGMIDTEIDFVNSNFDNTNVSIDSISVVAVMAENMANDHVSQDLVLGTAKKSIKDWVDVVKKLEINTNQLANSKEKNNSNSERQKVKLTEQKEIKEIKHIIDESHSINHYMKSKENFNEMKSKKINIHNVNTDNINNRKIDLIKIQEKFDEYFQKVDPFGTGRRDYEWWWVINPVFLNNILYDFKIKSPLIFKPEIMDSQFKYKHIIVGIYHDIDNDNSYFIYGVPGNMDYDKAPEDINSVWIKAGFDFQGNNTFGYWLIYFEPYSGNIINV